MDARRITGFWPLVALAPALVVAGCASGPSRPAPEPPPELTQEQQAELVQAERLYRAGDPDFDAERDRLSADPATAFWLARLFVFHLVKAHDQRRATDATFLATVAGTEDPTVTRAIAQLRAMGAAAAPALVRDLLRSPHSDRRQFGANLLSGMGPDVLPAVVPLQQSPDWRTRRMVVEIAAPMKTTPEVIAVLQRGAEDESFGVRVDALSGLLRHGEDQVERVRRALAEDPDPYVKRVLAKKLADHADRATAAALVAYYAECARNSDVAGADAAVESLQKISGHERSGDLEFWQTWLLGYSGKEQR